LGVREARRRVARRERLPVVAKAGIAIKLAFLALPE
jgi:hypothetical protein